MELKGINGDCKNESVAQALKKAGYKLRKKPVRWPKMKGPAGIRVDMSTGHAVDFVGRRIY